MFGQNFLIIINQKMLFVLVDFFLRSYNFFKRNGGLYPPINTTHSININMYMIIIIGILSRAEQFTQVTC
jgi:hypothetical protein